MITQIKKNPKNIQIARVAGNDKITWKCKDAMRPEFAEAFQEIGSYMPSIMGIKTTAVNPDLLIMREVLFIENQDTESIQLTAEYNGGKAVTVIKTGQVPLEEMPEQFSEKLDELRELAEAFLGGERQQLQLEFEAEEAA